MRWFISFLLGSMRLQATGLFPERLLNLCAQERIEFWAVTQEEEHIVSFTVRRSAWKRVQELAARIDCQIECRGSKGLPEFLVRFEKRYAFLVGLTICLCAVGFLSRFVLKIEVTGNQEVPTAVILNQLRQLGVKPGVYGPGLDRPHIAQQAVLELKDLAWMGINLSGTRLCVQVREREKEPERIDEYGFYHIAAETDGVIMQVKPELGDALVERGDTVTKGQILISGTVTLEPPIYSDRPNRYYQKHARGQVWARTWRNVEAVIPVEMEGKNYTGEEQSWWSINFFGRRIEIFGNSSISWPFYDKITTVRQMTIPGISELPVWWIQETCREYLPTALELDLAVGQEQLEQQLRKRLEQQIGENGEITQIAYTARVHDGLLRVKAQAECYEEIGMEVPGTQEEGK